METSIVPKRFVNSSLRDGKSQSGYKIFIAAAAQSQLDQLSGQELLSANKTIQFLSSSPRPSATNTGILAFKVGPDAYFLIKNRIAVGYKVGSASVTVISVQQVRDADGSAIDAQIVQLGSLDAGGGRTEKSITVKARGGLEIKASSATLGAEGFRVVCIPHPLDEVGNLSDTADALEVVVPAIGPFNGLYRRVDDGRLLLNFTAGFGKGMKLKAKAPFISKFGFSWKVIVPAQEQIHQNSAGYSISIYGEKL